MYQEAIQLTKHKTEYAGVSKFRCLPGHRHEEEEEEEEKNRGVRYKFVLMFLD